MEKIANADFQGNFMLTTRCMLMLCPCILIGGAIASSHNSTTARDDAGNGKSAAVEISLEIDKSQVRPGESIRLTELVPRVAKARVDVIRHSVLRIGRFDKKL